jgi:hypothetical protein
MLNIRPQLPLPNANPPADGSFVHYSPGAGGNTGSDPANRIEGTGLRIKNRPISKR